MNGIIGLLLIAATAQVGSEGERDFGWQINDKDGVVEYIVQIKPAEIAAMQNRSEMYPKGQEDESNIPPELVGHVKRVVIRIGDDILPRTPSLQEFDRMPRREATLDATTTAQLGPGRMQDVEAGSLYNIQQNNTPSLPALPGGLPAGANSNGLGPSDNLVDQASKAASALRDGANESLAGAVPAFADASSLAQNFNNQQAASSFLNESRGSRFNNTAPPANSGIAPPASSIPLPNNTNNAGKGYTGGGNTGATSNPAGLPSFPDPRQTPGSFNPASPNLPQQQTPAPGFGTTANAGNRFPGATAPNSGTNWNASPSTAPPYSDPYALPPSNSPGYASPGYSSPNYTNAPLSGSQYPHTPLQPLPQIQNPSNQNPPYDRLAANNGPLSGAGGGRATQPTGVNGNFTGTVNPQSGSGLGAGSGPSYEYPGSSSTTVDGLLQVLFLLSLVVNFYLGLLIRKLLMRYRSLLTNVRSQTA